MNRSLAIGLYLAKGAGMRGPRARGDLELAIEEHASGSRWIVHVVRESMRHARAPGPGRSRARDRGTCIRIQMDCARST
jgi:hypothetical protein